jgi:hypothetical protein
MARPRPDAHSVTAERISLLPGAVDTLTRDISAMIPRFEDVIYGHILDPDEVLLKDPDGYTKIYQDDQITTSLDNFVLPVAQAKWSFEATESDSQRLIPILTEVALKMRGFKQMLIEAAHAIITGIRIVRPVWKPTSHRGYNALTVKQWGFKDKRRFAPGDPDWEHMYLIDQGVVNTGTFTGFQKPLQRDWYILFQWRNTEDRLGWGAGVGLRLLKLQA